MATCSGMLTRSNGATLAQRPTKLMLARSDPPTIRWMPLLPCAAAAAALLAASTAQPTPLTVKFAAPVLVGSSNVTKFWFSRLAPTGHGGTLVLPAQRGGDGGGLPCPKASSNGCSGQLYTSMDEGAHWALAGPTGLSSINVDEGTCCNRRRCNSAASPEMSPCNF